MLLTAMGLAVLLGACDTAGANRVLAINATGTLTGLVYLDLNGNGRLDDNDPRPSGAGLELRTFSTRQRVASAVTASDGTFVIQNVPVGAYRIAVDPAVVGDSLEVRVAGGADVILEAGENQRPTVALSYMVVAVPRLRSLPVGRRVFVEGIALNNQSTFDDATVHVATDSGAIRATRVRCSVSAGDSVRFLGRISRSEGQTTLDDVQAFVIERRGFLSGPLTMVIDRGLSFNRLGPGAVIDATGLLIPLPGGESWFLRPVRSADLIIVQPPPAPPVPGSSM
jgi:hypothetical protein